MSLNVRGYAAVSSQSPLGLFPFIRRDPRPDDVVIEILYCGVCHSDIHNVRNDWGSATYPMVPGHDRHDGSPTYGCYSEKIVVSQDFVLKIPDGLDLKGAAPLLCAGITTWSPLRHWKIGKDSKVAVVGLGGLGHMAIKLAKGLGAEVTHFSPVPQARSRTPAASEQIRWCCPLTKPK